MWGDLDWIGLHAQQTMEKTAEGSWGRGWLAACFAPDICFTFRESSGENWKEEAWREEGRLYTPAHHLGPENYSNYGHLEFLVSVDFNSDRRTIHPPKLFNPLDQHNSHLHCPLIFSVGLQLPIFFIINLPIFSTINEILIENVKNVYHNFLEPKVLSPKASFVQPTVKNIHFQS